MYLTANRKLYKEANVVFLTTNLVVFVGFCSQTLSGMKNNVFYKKSGILLEIATYSFKKLILPFVKQFCPRYLHFTLLLLAANNFRNSVITKQIKQTESIQNTKLRKKAQNDFEEDYLKLMNQEKIKETLFGKDNRHKG